MSQENNQHYGKAICFFLIMQSLYSRGARYFWIHNTGPIGCLPLYLSYGPFTNLDKDRYGCAVYPNKISTEFNVKLTGLVKELTKKLPLATLTCVDIYATKYKLISEANKLGNSPSPDLQLLDISISQLVVKIDYGRIRKCSSASVIEKKNKKGLSKPIFSYISTINSDL